MAVPKAIQLIALRNIPRASRQINKYYRPGITIMQSTCSPTEQSHAPMPIRQFTTSLSLNAPNDSSTIDFAFLPNPDVFPEEGEIYRVPILPNNFTATTNTIEEDDSVVMKPEISTMSADAVFTPLADLSDGHAMNIDFHAMADRVAVNLRNMKVPAEQQASMMKQLWSDIVDDLFTTSKNTGTSSKA